ncbi:MAG: alpha/beta fold hydrolase, partial [Ignavibacteria bacterium]|nr:alpha/beta fold hydrolase [Ignavibacteria bacterium]
MQINFRKLGQGKPIIILHGLFGSLNNWLTVGKDLAERAEVYLVDQRNHGRSFHSNRHSYPLMAADLEHFMDERGLGEVDLIGHSMGGKTAMTFALLYPKRLRRLVVVDISPRSYPPGHDRIIDTLCGLPLGQITSREKADEMLARDISDQRVRQFLLTNITRDTTRKFTWKMNLAALKQNYSEVTKGIHSNQTSEVPALFIRGEKSQYIDRNDLVQIRRLFPAARLVTVGGAGHWVHADAR